MQDLRGVGRSIRYFKAVTGVYPDFIRSQVGMIIERGSLKEAQEAWEAWYRDRDGEVPLVWWDDKASRYSHESPAP